MRSTALRDGSGHRPGRWMAATAGLFLPLALVVAPSAAATSRMAPSRAANVYPACPSTQYGFSETRQSYGTTANGAGLDVDEYLPAASGGHNPPPTVPGVILVHGGEWITGNFTGGEGTSTTSGDGMSALAECFAQNGYDAFSIDYALTGTNAGVSELSFPQNLQDIGNAMTYVKAHVSNLQTSKLFILGQSAGGNLAGLAGENAMGYTPGLLGVISQSGPTDLVALGCTTGGSCPAGSVDHIVFNYLGCDANSPSSACNLEFANGTKTPIAGAQLYQDASPTYALASDTAAVPPYLLAGSSDEIIPVTQDTGLAQALNSNCTATNGTFSAQLAILPGDQHAQTYTNLVAGPALDFVSSITQGTLPSGCAVASPLTGASVAYDATTTAKTLIQFGGCCTSTGTASAATSYYDPVSDTWKPVTITGSSPPARVGAAFGWDPTSSDLVLFGGESVPNGTAQPQGLNDTWEFSYTASTHTGTWTQADTACTGGCPPAMYAAAADEAPQTQGVALFGGESVVPANVNGTPTVYGSLWVWKSTAADQWTQETVANAGSVPARYGAVMSFYGPNNLDVLFGGNQAPTATACGGHTSAGCLSLLNDTWKLTFNSTAGTWSWASGGTGPSAREYPAAASSATGMTLFGGLAGTGPGTTVNDEGLLADTWAWTPAGWATASCTPCNPSPPASAGAAMAYQRAAAQGDLYGGYTDTAPPAAPTTTWIWTGTAWQS